MKNFLMIALAANFFGFYPQPLDKAAPDHVYIGHFPVYLTGPNDCVGYLGTPASIRFFKDDVPNSQDGIDNGSLTTVRMSYEGLVLDFDQWEASQYLQSAVINSSNYPLSIGIRRIKVGDRQSLVKTYFPDSYAYGKAHVHHYDNVVNIPVKISSGKGEGIFKGEVIFICRDSAVMEITYKAGFDGA